MVDSKFRTITLLLLFAFGLSACNAAAKRAGRDLRDGMFTGEGGETEPILVPDPNAPADGSDPYMVNPEFTDQVRDLIKGILTDSGYGDDDADGLLEDEEVQDAIDQFIEDNVENTIDEIVENLKEELDGGELDELLGRKVEEYGGKGGAAAYQGAKSALLADITAFLAGFFIKVMQVIPWGPILR
jgi:predicted small secreted protein